MTTDFNIVNRDYEPICGVCLEVAELVDSPCTYNPEQLLNMPIGMHHCPVCAEMVVSGFRHPMICKSCADELSKELKSVESNG